MMKLTKLNTVVTILAFIPEVIHPHTAYPRFSTARFFFVRSLLTNSESESQIRLSVYRSFDPIQSEVLTSVVK
jgi:hypothetical protein